MMNKELAQIINKLAKERELIYEPELSTNPLKNILKIEIEGQGINTSDLKELVSRLDENKSLYGTNYDLIIRFKSR